MNSIREHGFISPILVRKKKDYYEIIDGEHRWRGAKELGMKKVVVNNLGNVTDEVAQQLTIIMNEVKGEADPQKLSSLLKALSEKIDLTILEKHLPYNIDELTHMISTNEIDWTSINPSLNNEDSEEKEAGYTIFQVKLKTELHDALVNHLNCLKIELAEGGNPQDISTSEAMESMIRHIITIP